MNWSPYKREAENFAVHKRGETNEETCRVIGEVLGYSDQVLENWVADCTVDMASRSGDARKAKDQAMHKRGESTEEWCTRIGAMVGRSGEEL